VLIPELRQLDPTRIWDGGHNALAGFSGTSEMDEPHPYWVLNANPMTPDRAKTFYERNPYNLGDLDNWGSHRNMLRAGVPQLANEYGWIWLWRDGRPAKLTVNNYDYYVGENATPDQRRELQAYWLQLETEWLRCPTVDRRRTGVLSPDE